jgi:hypothetical protein
LEFEMQPSPIALILANRLAKDEARSALPHAPVVAHVDKVSVVQRTRKVVASGLRHAADVIAPARPVRHPSARTSARPSGRPSMQTSGRTAVREEAC